jgi:GT2 family glycosyltransferase
VACRVEFFGAKTGPMVLPPFTLEGMLRRNLITASSVFRRADWQQVGGFCREVLLHEDYDFWLSLLELGGDVIQLDTVGLDYRKHSTWRPSKSHRARRTREAQAYRQIRERHLGLYARHPGVLLDWLAELDLDRVNRLDARLGSRLSRWIKERFRRG